MSKATPVGFLKLGLSEDALAATPLIPELCEGLFISGVSRNKIQKALDICHRFNGNLFF
jgi:hypothetical protein